MTALTIRLPSLVHESIKLLARKNGIFANQFIASATAEKMASFQTLDDLRCEVALVMQEVFRQSLNLAPNVPAQLGDEIFPDIDSGIKNRNKKP